jgi:hypothetical protein
VHLRAVVQPAIRAQPRDSVRRSVEALPAGVSLPA